MGWTIEDEIEIEPFAMAERKDNDPCPSLQDGGVKSNSSSLQDEGVKSNGSSLQDGGVKS